MIIRKATLEDVENGLLDVFIEGYRYHQNGRPDVFVNLTSEELKQDLIDGLSKFTILVLIDDNKIMGYLAYDFKAKHLKKMHVDQLVIKENVRGRGYGKMLMNEAIKIGKENACDRIELDCWCFNKDALAMYEHIGLNKQRVLFEYDLKE